MTKKVNKQKDDKKILQGLRGSARNVWLAGLGALATAEEEGSKLFQLLVEKGEGLEERGGKTARRLRDKAELTFDKVEKLVDEKLSAALHKVGVPTKKEIQDLNKRVEALNKTLGGLGKGGSRRKTARKGAAAAAAAQGEA